MKRLSTYLRGAIARLQGKEGSSVQDLEIVNRLSEAMNDLEKAWRRGDKKSRDRIAAKIARAFLR